MKIESISKERVEDLSLEDAWEFCISQWEWVIAKLLEDPGTDHRVLKRKWVKQVTTCPVDSDCFFCEYQRQQRAKSANNDLGTCESCPGKLVDSTFKCLHKDYSYEKYPFKFLLKIKELDLVRRCRDNNDKKGNTKQMLHLLSNITDCIRNLTKQITESDRK